MVQAPPAIHILDRHAARCIHEDRHNDVPGVDFGRPGNRTHEDEDEREKGQETKDRERVPPGGPMCEPPVGMPGERSGRQDDEDEGPRGYRVRERHTTSSSSPGTRSTWPRVGGTVRSE